jgi:hypothetical protein
LVLPHELSGLVKSRVVDSLVLITLVGPVISLLSPVLEIHVFHGPA